MESVYSGSLTREQFLFYEMRVTAKLICEGFKPDEALKKIYEDNLFQMPTERTVKSIAKACIKRIEILQSETLINMLAYSPAEEAKFIDLYSMMLYNRLVRDFMTTVIAEKYRTCEYMLTNRDLNLFFYRLQEQNDTVASWSDATIIKCKQVLRKSLVECGYLDSVKSETLNAVLISQEFENELKLRDDKAALEAFNVFSV